jgi:N-acetylated-alpha-linked acidic dipeptidase
VLEVFFNQVGRDVIDPEKQINVIERARAYAVADGSPDERKLVRDGNDLPLDPLGSGSDYSPFLQHIGISALNIGYGGEDDYGQYHSIYDSFAHYVRFEDPKFEYGVTLAKTGGRTVLRLADADVLPIEFQRMSGALGRYVKEVVKLADDQRDETAEKNRRIDDCTYTATYDPTKTYIVPKKEDPVPFLNFAPLQNAAADVERAAAAYDKASKKRASSGKPLTTAQQASLDLVLMRSERALTRPQGLPRRPCYIHHVRARVLHGLWREDAARRARGDRAEALEGSRGRGRDHGRGAARVRRRDRQGHEIDGRRYALGLGAAALTPPAARRRAPSEETH